MNGLDANNGLGPDASAVTNKPWKTIAKLLGAAGMSSGDTAYLSPAGPFREVVTVAMTSAVAETKILGDPWNQQGFKTSGGARVDPGPVIWTAWLTNDKTAPSTSTLLTLAGRDNLTFERILMYGGNNATASHVNANTTTATNITFRWCTMIPRFTRQIIDATTVFGTAFNWLIEHCRFGPSTATNALQWTAPTGAGSNYDVGVTIRDCLFLACGSVSVNLSTSGASAQKPGGLVVRNCDFVDCRSVSTGANVTSAIPVVVVGNVIYSMAGTGIAAGAASNITEDYNLIFATTPLSGSPTSGGHSITDASYCPMFNFMGEDQTWGAPEPRPWMEPLKSSPALAFGGDGSAAATDVIDLPRPSTAALQAVGAYGTRHNTFVRDPSPIGGGGAFALRIVGPGDYGLRIPVEEGVSYDITYDVEWDATYAGSKPQLVLDANPRIGVAAQTITAVGSSGSPETLTLATITPTSRDFDFVIVRVVSRDTNGAGLVQSDDLTVA